LPKLAGGKLSPCLPLKTGLYGYKKRKKGGEKKSRQRHVKNLDRRSCEKLGRGGFFVGGGRNGPPTRQEEKHGNEKKRRWIKQEEIKTVGDFLPKKKPH